MSCIIQGLEMTDQIKLTHKDIKNLCLEVVPLLKFKIAEGMGARESEDRGSTRLRCYPIPRGGVSAAYALGRVFPLTIVDHPDSADFLFDDIIDSGATRDEWKRKFPDMPFFALINKRDKNGPYSQKGNWIIFPWEGDAKGGIEHNITRILQFIGDDPKREGLRDTPARVTKALEHWFSGYNKLPSEVIKTFTDGADRYDQMIVVKDIPIYSKCEHHMADIFGTVTIAYIPNGKIVGLSKLSRLTDIYAKRLQVQERLTQQIAESLYKVLEPEGVGVMIRARHMCMESRGIQQQGHHTVTSALLGAFKDEPATRAEFMSLAIQ